MLDHALSTTETRVVGKRAASWWSSWPVMRGARCGLNTQERATQFFLARFLKQRHFPSMLVFIHVYKHVLIVLLELRRFRMTTDDKI